MRRLPHPLARRLLLLHRNRGSSGSTPEWLPTDIGGCVLWLRSDLAWQDAAKTVPCTNESLIWTGEDKSLDNDVIQATEAARPVYLTNQINGHPVWRFDGIDDYLSTSVFYAGTEFSLFAVFKSSDNAAVRLFNGNAGYYGYGFFTNVNRILMYGGVNGGELANGIPTADPELWEGIGALNDKRFYINGGTPASSDKNPNVPQGSFVIGINTDFTSWPLDGDIAEIILYNSALSDANRQRLELYFNTEAQGTGYAIW